MKETAPSRRDPTENAQLPHKPKGGFWTLLPSCVFLLTVLCLFPRPLHARDLPLHVTDALGHALTLKTYPKRIVSLAPSNTELLYAVGAGDQVVGVTEQCDYPPAAVKKPKIGGFANPNLELIVSLRPDLVLAARHNPMDVLDGLRKLGIPVFALAPSTLDSALTTLRQVGRITGHDAAAARLEAALRVRIRAVEAAVAGIPKQDRLRVLWGQLEAPMYTAGPGSFIDDLIRRAGGVNIASDAREAWPQIGLETVVARNPQVIIVSVANPKNLGREIERLRHTPGWEEVDAVRTGRIYNIDLDLLGRPGPRLVDGLEHLARALYPDRFSG